jgi:hypothetical protein
VNIFLGFQVTRAISLSFVNIIVISFTQYYLGDADDMKAWRAGEYGHACSLKF